MLLIGHNQTPNLNLKILEFCLENTLTHFHTKALFKTLAQKAAPLNSGRKGRKTTFVFDTCFETLKVSSLLVVCLRQETSI